MTNFKNEFHKKRFKKYLKNPVKASDDEMEEVKKLYEIEYKWWADEKTFQTNKDIEKAFKNKKLVEVIEDKNIKPIMRLKNPDLKNYPPYLDKETYKILKEIGEKWRKKAEDMNIPNMIKLSITSLTRSVEYQKEIVSMGKMAVENSSHTKGKSFDIDGCGYYIGEEAINPRFTKNYEEKYNPQVHQILESVLEEIKNENKINYIPEYKGTDNQCFHITRAPIR